MPLKVRPRCRVHATLAVLGSGLPASGSSSANLRQSVCLAVAGCFFCALALAGAVMPVSSAPPAPAPTPAAKAPLGDGGEYLASFVLPAAVAPDEDLAPLGPQPKPAAAGTDYAAGEILVRFHDNVGAAIQSAVLQEHGLTLLGRLLLPGMVRVQTPDGDELAWVQRLGQDRRVRYAEPNYYYSIQPPADVQAIVQGVASDAGLSRTPNDTYYASRQWNMPNINAPAAWDVTTGNGAIQLAVLDTGFDYGHPDLSCAGKAASGYDFYDNDSTPQDAHGHGTHVAGIAGACSNNGAGVAGVNWNVQIMPIRVLGASGSGSTSGIINGMAWAADHGARVINMSLGGTSYSQAFQDACTSAHNRGVLVIAAAGNEYEDGNPIEYPAAYANVMAVAATGNQNEKAWYSNTGSYVDIAAPGGSARSSSDGDWNHWITSNYWRGSGSAYAGLIGTSMAAPHVAGLAAMIFGVNNTLTPAQVSNIIQSTALDLGAAGRDNVFGYGRINMQAALAAIPSPGTPTRTVTPGGTTPTRTVTRTSTPTPTPSFCGWTDIVTETFELAWPGPWRLMDTGSGSGDYYWGKRTCRPYVGSNSGWAIGGGSGASLTCGASYPINHTSWMVYGPFSLVSATAGDLTAKIWVNSEAGYDGLCLMASVNDNNYYGSCRMGVTGGWITYTLDLANVYSIGNLMGQPQVWISLIFVSDYSITYAEGAYADNIVLRKYAACSGGTPTRTPTQPSSPPGSPTRTPTQPSSPPGSRTPTQPSSPPSPTATSTPTHTATPTATATPTPRRVYLPVIVRQPTPSATPTSVQAHGWTPIVDERFEADFPGGWQLQGAALDSTAYTWAKRNCRPYQGTFSGWAVGGGTNGQALSCGSAYANSTSSAMVFGPFSLADATAAEVMLKLWLYSEQGYDWFCIAASGSSSALGTFDGPCVSGNSAGWIDRSLNLANVPTWGNMLGRAQVWIAVLFMTDGSVVYSEGAYADNVIVRKCLGQCVASAEQEDGADIPGITAASLSDIWVQPQRK